MDAVIIITDYLLWHYTRAFRDMAITMRNVFYFVVHFFSIPLLIRTLFAPFKRVTEAYEHRGIEAFMETFVVNVMTRIVGAFVRLSIILIGLLTLVFTVFGCLFFFIFWVTAPFVLSFLFCKGLIVFIAALW